MFRCECAQCANNGNSMLRGSQMTFTAGRAHTFNLLAITREYMSIGAHTCTHVYGNLHKITLKSRAHSRCTTLSQNIWSAKAIIAFNSINTYTPWCNEAIKLNRKCNSHAHACLCLCICVCLCVQ